MENSPSQQQETVVERQKPFLLRVAAILVIVQGVTGFLFFLMSVFTLAGGAETALKQELTGGQNNLDSFYIIVQLAIHALLIFSGVLLFRLRKAGFYLFIISYLILVTASFFFNDEWILIPLLAGILLLLLLLFYRKKFR